MNRLYPEQQVDITKIDANFQEICADSWVTEGRLAVNSVPASKLVNGAATDIKIGTRTMDDTTAPTSKSGMLQDHLNNIGYMLKSITGKDDCITAPNTPLGAPPIARVTMSADQGLTTTMAKVKFNTKTFDVGGYFDTATYQYTPPAGYYRVTVTGVMGNLNTVIRWRIYKADSLCVEQFINPADTRATSFPFYISDVISVNGLEAISIRAAATSSEPFIYGASAVAVFEKICDN
jgi:hypothetical protein